MALLVLDGISKRFGRVTVAEELSLQLDDGAALGVVGPNGAGKTSLFSVISGDLRPDSGEVFFDGHAITGLDTSARCRAGIGRTYQIPRPFEHMTVFENTLVAAQAGAGLRRRAAYQAAAEALHTAGLFGRANVLAGRLTLLDRKRLELGRALATRPRLLLLDEVAGGLTDPEVDELVEVVTRLHAGGLAIVWIEHVVHALARAVPRLLCLAGGAILADGAPEAVLASTAVRDVYLGGGPELAVVVP